MKDFAWNFEDASGPTYYAEIAANPYVLEIMLAARGNKTELGYWREIATELAKLVDTLIDEVDGG